MKHSSIPLCGRAARLALALFIALAPAALSAQTTPEPRRDQLLNGLRVVTLSRPGDPQTLLRLRVHTGAAFDLAGKEGLTALLGDALFDAQTREYVSDELGGRIEVSTTYDSVDIVLAGRAQDFDRLLELLRNAVINTQLTPEAVTALRDARRKALAEKRSAAETADRAASARLYNVHPYARPVAGTPESVARVERPDLMLLRERFLNPNNSTLVVVGGVEHRRVMNALRQTVGAWRKSDRLVPETFRRPEATDARVLVVGEPESAGVEVRLAVRGLARNDRDRPAAQVLAHLVRDRWAAAFPDLREHLSARHEAHRDGGLFILSAAARTPAEAAKALETGRAVLDTLSTAQPSAAELDAARRAYLETLDAAQRTPEGWAAAWLDEHSYKTPSVMPAETARVLGALTPAEAQRVAARLFQHTPAAAVAVGDAAALRAELARLGGVEVFGEAAAAPAVPPASQPKPAPTPAQKPGLQLKRP